MTNSSDGIKALLLGKTGKKLCAFSLGVFLLIAVLVFSASLSYYRNRAKAAACHHRFGES